VGSPPSETVHDTPHGAGRFGDWAFHLRGLGVKCDGEAVVLSFELQMSEAEGKKDKGVAGKRKGKE